MSLSFHIFANAALGKGLSGSDRIFIELAKRLRKKAQVFLYVWKEGYQMCQRQNLKQGSNVYFSVINLDFWCRFGFVICYMSRIVLAVRDAFRLKISTPRETVFYSASEFWMDSLPAFILKLRYPKAKWVAGWFQTAPNFFKGFTEGDRKKAYRLSAFYYWFIQLPIKPLIDKFADIVLVNNELEKKEFPKLNRENTALVLLGAVNVLEINKFKKKFSKELKIYDAVFQGRFHPQKGVVELIEIWKLVTETIPGAKLALIGDGPLMNDVRLKIAEFNLQKNIQLFGYVFDGPEKYKIFAESKIAIHPAFYDSGGMAAAEAMAFGLPAVGFDLDSYRSYYPIGMIKVKIGNLKEFANTIIGLINKGKERKKLGLEAEKMVLKSWSWEHRLSHLMSILKISL